MAPPGLDLRVIDKEGRVTGVKQNGEFVNNIPGAEASGDANQGMEWVSVPSDTEVRVVVSDQDLQRYLAESGLSSENVTAGYNLSRIEYGTNPELVVSNGNLSVTNTTISIQSGVVEGGKSTVVEPPTASFSVLTQELVAGETIAFDAADQTSSTGSLTYEWDFDDDGTIDATGRTVNHTFDRGGNKIVTLIVSDEDGVVQRTSKTISVDKTAIGSTIDSLSSIVALLRANIMSVAAVLILLLLGLLSFGVMRRS
jgi:PKD repeat protein